MIVVAEAAEKALAELRARYRAASEALASAQAQELAALSDEEAFARTLSLSLFSGEPMPSSESSGLVEQQAIFRRWRR